MTVARSAHSRTFFASPFGADFPQRPIHVDLVDPDVDVVEQASGPRGAAASPHRPDGRRPPATSRRGAGPAAPCRPRRWNPAPGHRPCRREGRRWQVRSTETDRRRLLELGVGEAIVEPALVVGDLEPGLVEVGERAVSAPCRRCGSSSACRSACRAWRRSRPAPVRACGPCPTSRHRTCRQQVGDHRAERHLDVVDLDAERRRERRQHIHVEAFELAGRRIAHAEHRRVHGGADAQDLGVQHALQPVRALGGGG